MSEPDPAQADSGVVELINDRQAIDGFEARMLAAVDRAGFSKVSRFAIRLATEEALMNAFKHGHKGLPATVPVRIEYSVTPERVIVAIEDRGPGFKPGAIVDPTLDENLETPSGRGLMLMRAYLTTVEHNSAGNRVEMTYRRPNDDENDE